MAEYADYLAYPILTSSSGRKLGVRLKLEIQE
jgi:hypothetical protein